MQKMENSFKRSKSRSRSNSVEIDAYIQERSQKIRKTEWDIPPVDYQNMTPMEYKQMLASRPVKLNTNSNMDLNDATNACQARSLYIANLPFGINEKDLKDFFNETIRSKGLMLSDGDPILACRLNVEKNYAFLDFRSEEETTLSMTLNGINFRNQILVIQRPDDLKFIKASAECLTDIDVDTNSKLFICNLLPSLKEEDIKQLLTPFGELRSFQLARHPRVGLSKCFAFFEYKNRSVTDAAIAGLNGLLVCGRKLVVERATYKKTVTEVLCLHNVITLEELRNEKEYFDVMEDVQMECNKYGTVTDIQIPKIFNDANQFNGYGKVYIEFKTKRDCAKAYSAITGRKFSNRPVLTSYYSLEKYRKREF